MEDQTNLTIENNLSRRPAEQLSTAPLSDIPSSVLGLIERVVLDPRIDAEKLDRIMAWYDQLKAKEAERAYNAAKGRILKKLAGIKIVKNRTVLCTIEKGKQKNGTYEPYRYAPLEEIDKHLRPLLAEEDMDLSYSDEPLERGGVLICGRLKHLPSGHYEDSLMPAPLDRTGGKSTYRQSGARILFSAAISPATSSTLWWSGMMTTEPGELSTRSRRGRF
jgi:hypothetical protein